MIIPVLGPSTLQEYVDRGEPAAPRPDVCPKCQSSESFWRHDSFDRRAIEGELSKLSHVCGLAASCIFAFLVPYRRATAAVIARAVSDYSLSETTYREEAEELSQLNSDTTPEPSHGQVFRWVATASEKAGQLLLQVQKELVMGGQVEAVQGGGCPNAYKAHTVKKAMALNELAELAHLAGLLMGTGGLRDLQAHFLTEVESLQAICAGHRLQLANPQRMQHMIF